MTVPQQKKPKKSFEEALFEGIPSSVSIKRQSTSQEDTSITTSRMNKEKVEPIELSIILKSDINIVGKYWELISYRFFGCFAFSL